MNLSEFEDAYDDVAEEIERIGGVVLETPVSELMARDPLVVDADATVAAAIDAMIVNHIGCVLVQKAGKLVGIFTERDVLRKVVFHEGNKGAKVSAVMTRDPESLPPSASVAFALNRMSVDGYRHIPIVDRDEKPIGVLSIRDIVDMVAESFPQGVLNLPGDPSNAIPKTTDGG